MGNQLKRWSFLILFILVISVGVLWALRYGGGLVGGAAGWLGLKSEENGNSAKELPKFLELDWATINRLSQQSTALSTIEEFPTLESTTIVRSDRFDHKKCKIVIDNKEELRCSDMNIKQFRLEFENGQGVLSIMPLGNNTINVGGTLILSQRIYAIDPIPLRENEKLRFLLLPMNHFEELTKLLVETEANQLEYDSEDDPDKANAPASGSTQKDQSESSANSGIASKSQALTADGVWQTVGEIQVETDREFFTNFSIAGQNQRQNIATVTQRLGYIFSAVNMIYDREVRLAFRIAGLYLYPTSEDPWTKSDKKTALSEFRRKWPILPGRPANATFVHLIGAKFGGGYAMISSRICRRVLYGVSGIGYEGDKAVDELLPAATANKGIRAAFILAHELGHNFNSKHTFDYDPPIDCCSLEGRSYDRCTQEVYGDEQGNIDVEALEAAENFAPIMSYCPGRAAYFSDRERNTIRQQRERGIDRGCLEDLRNAEPVIDQVRHPETVSGRGTFRVTASANDPDGDEVYYVLEGKRRTNVRLISLNGVFDVPNPPPSFQPYDYRVSVYDKSGINVGRTIEVYSLPNVNIYIRGIGPNVGNRAEQGVPARFEAWTVTDADLTRERAQRMIIEFGDGLGPYTEPMRGNNESYETSHRYMDAGNFTISAYLEHPYGRNYTVQIPVEVRELEEPTIREFTLNGHRVVGAPIQVQGSFSVQQNGAAISTEALKALDMRYIIDFGDGTRIVEPLDVARGVFQVPFSRLYHYRRPGNFTATLTCQHRFGACARSTTRPMTIIDQTVLIDGVSIPRNIQAGNQARMLISFSNPSNDPLKFKFVWGDGTKIKTVNVPPDSEVRRRGIELNHVYPRNGSFQLRIEVELNSQVVTTYNTNVQVGPVQKNRAVRALKQKNK